MPLWVDKYRPKTLKTLDYHLEQAKNLQKLTKSGDFPHLLVYGPEGAGKKTRIMCLLRELYGPGVEKIRMEQMNFKTASKKNIEIMALSSNYHIEVSPSDAGIHDRIIVMELIKNVAQSHQLDSVGQREFKVIVLSDVDTLTKDAQFALRRTMEKHIKNCRLILCANSTSKVTPAIRSRCLSIRVPAPAVEDVIKVLHNVSIFEKFTLPAYFAKKIAVQSNRNLRRALLMLEDAKQVMYPFKESSQVREPDWETAIKLIGKEILKQQSIQKIQSVRTMLYELITHGIPSSVIFKTLLDTLLEDCDISLKEQVVSEAAKYEHRLAHGGKDIYHFEGFVTMFMKLYKHFLEDSLKGMM